MRWQNECVERLELARRAMATPAFAAARVQIRDRDIVLHVVDDDTTYSVSISTTSAQSLARNNWRPPPDTWFDVPIIDKTYSTQKLNLYRYGAQLEGTITAYRGDSSPRAPPVPEWLRKFVEVFKRAVEDCLGEIED